MSADSSSTVLLIEDNIADIELLQIASSTAS
jgi:hypothetical protein